MMRSRERPCCRSPRDQERMTTERFGTPRRRLISLSSTRIGKSSVVHWQTNVVFGQGLRSSARTGDVVEFGDLAALVERVVARKAVQHGSHPPGKSLHFPNAAQADLRVTFEQLRFSFRVKFRKRPG